MEAAENGSANSGRKLHEKFSPGFNNLSIDEFNSLIAAPLEIASSFTALLELPPSQAVELLVHSPEAVDALPTRFPEASYSVPAANVPPPMFPVNSVFATAKSSPESSCAKRVKQEQLDFDSSPTPSHALLDTTLQKSSNKRKGREKKEMWMLQHQEKGVLISGTASVLDEIIKHVQFLQRKVEFLAMKLAAADPRISFNLDNFKAAENGSPVRSNVRGMVLPSAYNEQIRPQYQHLWHLDGFQQPVLVKEDESSNLIHTENTASSKLRQLKMEL